MKEKWGRLLRNRPYLLVSLAATGVHLCVHMMDAVTIIVPSGFFVFVWIMLPPVMNAWNRAGVALAISYIASFSVFLLNEAAMTNIKTHIYVLWAAVPLLIVGEILSRYRKLKTPPIFKSIVMTILLVLPFYAYEKFVNANLIDIYRTHGDDRNVWGHIVIPIIFSLPTFVIYLFVSRPYLIGSVGMLPEENVCFPERIKITGWIYRSMEAIG